MQVLTANDIRVVRNVRGWDVVVIPDDVAALLVTEVRTGWREYDGQGYGRSRFFLPGTWTHDTAEQIIAAYGASPVPAGLSGEDLRRAELKRRRARDHGECAGSFFLIGESGWDDDNRDWRYPPGHPECERLWVPHFPNREVEWDPVTDERQGGIQWHG